MTGMIVSVSSPVCKMTLLLYIVHNTAINYNVTYTTTGAYNLIGSSCIIELTQSRKQRPGIVLIAWDYPSWAVSKLKHKLKKSTVTENLYTDDFLFTEFE